MVSSVGQSLSYSASLFEGKTPKAIRKFLDKWDPAGNFADEKAFRAFLEAVKSLQDESLLASTLARVQAVRPIPRSFSVSDHDVAIFSGDELVFTCPKALLLELDIFKTMLNSNSEESEKVDGKHQLRFSYSKEVLLAFKKYIYGESLEGIALNKLLELQAYLHMVSGQEKHERVEKAILDYFLDDAHEFEEECFINDPTYFVETFFAIKGIKCDHNKIKLSDFILHFQGKNSRLYQLILKKIGAIRVDVTDFSALYLIEKSYRRQISYVELDIIVDSDIAKVLELRKLFKNAGVYVYNLPANFLERERDVDQQVILISALLNKHTAPERLHKIVRENSCLATAHEALGYCLGHYGEYNEALPYLRKAVELDPKLAFAHLELGDCLRMLCRFDEAIPYLEKAIELDPKSAFAHERLGDCLRLLGRFDEAIPHLEKAVELCPKSGFAHERLGDCLRRLGRFDEAMPYLELRPMSAFAHERLGDCLRQLGRFDEAIPHLEKAIELNPKSAFAHARLGDCLRQLGRFEEALPYLQKAIELDRKSVFAYKVHGDCLKVLGRYAEAMLYFQETIELDPKDAAAHVQLGDCLRKHDSYREALPYLKEAIKLDPKSSFAHWVLGDCLRVLGRFEEAILYLEKAIEVNSKSVEAHELLGDCLRMLGRFEEALPYLQKAIELNPKSVFAHLMLGDCLRRLGKYEQAVFHLEAAVKLDPTTAFARKWLADCQAELLGNRLRKLEI